MNRHARAVLLGVCIAVAIVVVWWYWPEPSKPAMASPASKEVGR